uniref:Acyl_transf_3 domain-containing protein n=1 Tax=Rhabditophanes sp. KR3021 TaxID=114890 RepID=A0AC35TKR1_9BILA
MIWVVAFWIGLVVPLVAGNGREISTSGAGEYLHLLKNMDKNAVHIFLEETQLGEKHIYDYIAEHAIKNNWKYKECGRNDNFVNLPISEDCAEDMCYILAEIIQYNGKDGKENITELKGTGIPMLIDAGGKIGAGLSRGNFHANGLRTMCQSISVNIPTRDRPLKGQVSKIFFDLARNHLDNEPCDKKTVFFNWDVCIPDTCANRNDLYLISRLIGRNNKTKEARSCSVGIFKTKNVLGYQGIIVYCVLGIFFLIGTLISLWEILVLPHHKHAPYARSLPIKFARCLSIYANVKSIFKIKNVKRAQYDEHGVVLTATIDPIHCMRFISMFWVIMGHCAVMVAVTNNPLDVLTIVGDYPTQFLVNAYFAVDTFFFMGGVLLSFIWFKNFKKNKRRTNSLISWVMLYAHRILRLSPPYFMAVAFYTFIFTNSWLGNMTRYLGAGFGDSDNCRSNWWINLLYLQNYINVDKQCYLITWYLATDLQIFLFTPLIVVPLAFRPMVGFAVSGALLALSTAANIVTMYVMKFPPTDFNYGPQDPLWPHWKYTMLIYNAPWIRCQVYIFGLLVGYMLQYKRSLRMHPLVAVVGWIASLACMVGCIISVADWAGGTQMDMTSRAMYSAFSKIGWSMGLSWIIIACYYGHGGIINKFMSLKLWVPLGKLSFCSYLIHYMVVLYFYGMDQGEYVFTSVITTILNVAIPVTVISYFISVFWSALFEVGIGRMIELALAPPRRPPREEVATVTIQNEDGKSITVEHKDEHKSD